MSSTEVTCAARVRCYNEGMEALNAIATVGRFIEACRSLGYRTNDGRARRLYEPHLFRACTLAGVSEHSAYALSREYAGLAVAL